MTTAEIIENFELNVDDQSTLSSSESLGLANRIYRRVLNERAWEWLKKEGTGTVSSGQVSAPSDFSYFVPNFEDDHGDFIPVVLVGTDYQPYKVIPFSERNDVDNRDADGVCYYDARQEIIVFPGSSAEGKSIIYDYIYEPDALTSGTSPVFKAKFHDIIFYGMSAEFAPIDNMPKARSYQEDWLALYDGVLVDMQYENSKLYGGPNY